MKLSVSQRELVSRLYAAHYFTLLCYAESALRRKDAAEEAVQETFRIACTHAARLETLDNPGGWLMGILKNILRNRGRVLARFRNVFSPLPLEDAAPAVPDQTGELDIAIAGVLTPEEYELVCDCVEALGFEGFLQDPDSADAAYTPEWNERNE